MKKYKFYVTDWAPNGCNSLLIYHGNKQVDYLEEVLFGIDVNKLNTSGVYLNSHDSEAIFRIKPELIKKHVASCPYPGVFEGNCSKLSKYI